MKNTVKKHEICLNGNNMITFYRYSFILTILLLASFYIIEFSFDITYYSFYFLILFIVSLIFIEGMTCSFLAQKSNKDFELYKIKLSSGLLLNTLFISLVSIMTTLNIFNINDYISFQESMISYLIIAYLHITMEIAEIESLKVKNYDRKRKEVINNYVLFHNQPYLFYKKFIYMKNTNKSYKCLVLFIVLYYAISLMLSDIAYWELVDYKMDFIESSNTTFSIGLIFAAVITLLKFLSQFNKVSSVALVFISILLSSFVLLIYFLPFVIGLFIDSVYQVKSSFIISIIIASIISYIFYKNT